MCFGLEESNQSSVENRRSDDEDRLLGIMKEVMGDGYDPIQLHSFLLHS